ncbi:MAG: ester cyclase, partial [Actinobacteria bacterium]|nr:ester cyclase [Actinomycetota bacterium]
MGRDDTRALYERMLLGLWHADDGALDERAASVAHDELIIHQNGERRHGAAALAELVRAGRAAFTGVTVEIDAGPVIDGSFVAARWRFSGVYTGGIPGATADERTPVNFTG